MDTTLGGKSVNSVKVLTKSNLEFGLLYNYDFLSLNR